MLKNNTILDIGIASEEKKENNTQEPTKMFKLVGDKGIQVLSKKFRRGLDKMNISASMMNSFLQSPADFVLDRYLNPLVSDQNALHLDRGNWFHAIMENFFAKTSKEERTLDSLKENKILGKLIMEAKDIVDKRTGQKTFEYLYDDKENIEWLKRGMNNYFKNMDDHKPEEEKIALLYINGKQQPGLELYINGTIGDSKRRCGGFIDKVVENVNGLKIQDWKTGKYINDFDPSQPISDYNSFDYWRQQILYALLLEQNGCVVEAAELIFPMANPPTTVKVDMLSNKWREQTIEDVNTVSRELDECIANDYFFPFKQGKNNGWSAYLGGNKYGNGRLWNVRYDEIPLYVDME